MYGFAFPVRISYERHVQDYYYIFLDCILIYYRILEEAYIMSSLMLGKYM